jgi:hypothetical protein
VINSLLIMWGLHFQNSLILGLLVLTLDIASWIRSSSTSSVYETALIGPQSFLSARQGFYIGLLDRFYKTIQQKHGDKLGMPPKKLLGTTCGATKTSKAKKNFKFQSHIQRRPNTRSVAPPLLQLPRQ